MDTTGAEGSLALVKTPVSASTLSGYDILVWKDGVGAKFATGSVSASSTIPLWVYNSGSNQIEFVAGSGGDYWYTRYKGT